MGPEHPCLVQSRIGVLTYKAANGETYFTTRAEQDALQTAQAMTQMAQQMAAEMAALPPIPEEYLVAQQQQEQQSEPEQTTPATTATTSQRSGNYEDGYYYNEDVEVAVTDSSSPPACLLIEQQQPEQPKLSRRMQRAAWPGENKPDCRSVPYIAQVRPKGLPESWFDFVEELQVATF